MSSSASKARQPSSSRGGKNKSSKTIVLKLQSSHLSRWPHDKPAPKPPSSKSSSSNSTPAVVPKEDTTPVDVKTENNNGSPAKDSAALQIPTDTKKKAPAAARSGTKRSSSALNDGQSKPRAKPGPKRRKLYVTLRLIVGKLLKAALTLIYRDGTLGGDEASRPWTTPAPLAGHKLGPKANQGAINAGLRALDRSGKPCRKWSKKGFTVKSFTGIAWSLPSWGAPSRQKDDSADHGENETPTSNSENQPAHSSSNVGSDTSRPNNTMEANNLVSSPAIVSTPA